MANTFDEAVETLYRIAKNNSKWVVDDSMSHKLTLHQKVAGIAESDQIFALKAQMQAVQIMLKNLTCTT